MREFQDEEEERRRKEADNLVSRIFKEVLQELQLEENPFKSPVKSKKGEEIPGTMNEGRELPGGERNGDKSGSNQSALPLIKTDKQEHKERVKYVALPNWDFAAFEGKEAHLHSKLDELLGGILINNAHKDYAEISSNTEAFTEYLLLILAKETVLFENRGEPAHIVAEEIIKIMSLINRKKGSYLKKGVH